MKSAGQISNDIRSLSGLGRPAMIQLIKEYNLSINIIQYPEGEDDKLRGAIKSQLKSMLQRSLAEEQSVKPPQRSHAPIRVLILTVMGVAIASLVYIYVWPLLNKREAAEVAKAKQATKTESKQIAPASNAKPETPTSPAPQSLDDFDVPPSKPSTVVATSAAVETVKVKEVKNPSPPATQKTPKLEDLID